MNTYREQIIQNYVKAYNNFDTKTMTLDFDEAIVFENFQNVECTMSLIGIVNFEKQAEEAKQYFSSREQIIELFEHSNDTTEVAIRYQAILAQDLPNGMKRGDAIKLIGKSIFRFSGNKIIQLTDRV